MDKLLPAAGQAAPRTPQIVMGACWTAMGAACVVFPEQVLRLSLSPKVLPEGKKEKDPSLQLMTQCFGAQAVMCGILLCSSKLDSRGYAIWGLALLPFFWFDYSFWKRGTLTTFGAAGDLAGNLVFMACSAVGAGWVKID